MATLIRINAGGGSFTDAAGRVWAADQSFSGGAPSMFAQPISGTTDDLLYQTERYGNFSYQIPVPNGGYEVDLHFAEIFWTAAGQRVFDVFAEGTLVVDNLDIVSRVGALAPLLVTVPVVVNDGVLSLQFVPSVNYAKISAIEVRSVEASSLETGGNTSMRSAVAGTGSVNIRSAHPGPTRLVFSTPQSFKPGDYVSVTVPGYPHRFRFTIDFGSGTEWQAKEPTTLDQSGFTTWFRSNPQPGRVRGGSRFVASAKHYLYVAPLDQAGNPDWYAYVDTTMPVKSFHPYTGDMWTGLVWLGKDGNRYDPVKLIEDVRTRVDNLDGLVS